MKFDVGFTCIETELMSAKDLYHDTMRNALVKAGWTITHDPYTITFGQKRGRNRHMDTLDIVLPDRDASENADTLVSADTLNRYRGIIRERIQYHAQFQPARGDVQIEVIFDAANDHYELMYAGWNGPYRIHGSVVHIDIRNGKVWIQHDGTEAGIANELAEAGIPRDRIVLAFKSPDIRPYTGFAIA